MRSEPDMTLPLIDEAVMGEWTADLDPADVAEILAQVPGQCAACLDELKAAVAAEELAKAKRVAHKLKGMAANLGAVRLSRMARGIEIESEQLADVALCLPAVGATIAQTIAALAQPG
ncbi:MAG: Hpt domain-containing protein [Hyphomicrobiaceae bacterium]|nr:Hpt domain-containing protein [Hyphomicrobiaceae bacterium]